MKINEFFQKKEKKFLTSEKMGKEFDFVDEN